MPEQELVFVLGMGRSGTSLLTRVLSLCGAGLPDRLFGAAEGNPTGHWEPLAALEINEAFLGRFASSWYDPTFRLQGEVAIADQEREAYIRQICGFLQSCASPLFVVKEPRITALTEYWFEAARRLGLGLKIAIPVRHPDEVAASLATRDGVSSELSGLLWLKYNLLAERVSRPFPRVFVACPRLVRDWRGETARIASALALRVFAPDEAAIDAFIAPELYHQQVGERPANFVGRDWIRDVYAALCAAAVDERLDTHILDATFHALKGSERLFRTAIDEFRKRFQVQPG
jgi:hypothetical protein